MQQSSIYSVLARVFVHSEGGAVAGDQLYSNLRFLTPGFEVEQSQRFLTLRQTFFTL